VVTPVRAGGARRRAALVVVDGLRADMIDDRTTPSLWGIAERSRVFTEHRSVFPSATRVNSASLATGCHPSGHGLAGNAVALDEGEGLRPVSVGPPDFRDRLRRATGRTLARPTLAERLASRGGAAIYSNSSAGSAHMQDPDGFGHLYHRSGSFGPGLTPMLGPRHLDVTYDAAGDTTTTERFCEALEQDPDSDLFVLWICEPDHSQHVLELGSPAHREVIAAADRCAGAAFEAVEALRSRGEEVLLAVCSDHGHETVDEVVPVTDLLVGAGLKAARDSGDLVLASSGMGALIYLSEPTAERTGAVATWLNTQPWCAEVFAGPELARARLPTGSALAVAFSMAKRDAPNRFGVRGYGHVAADAFMQSDAPGLGQHGGLGPSETRPFLMVSGGDFVPGTVEAPTSAVDVAPTILAHLDAEAAGVDGSPLPTG
jgi:arylsulfatase A-like enzyme